MTRLTLTLSLTLAVTLLSVAPDAGAKCRGTWLSAFPDKTIHANSWLVLQAGGQARELVRNLANHRAALVRQGERVEVTVMAVHDGQFNVTQAIIRPSKPLTRGATYRLSLDEAAVEAASIGWDLKRLEWTVGPPSGSGTPRWSGAPTVDGSRYTRYGCGPAKYVDMRLPVVDTGLLGALVEVRPAGAKARPVRFLVPIRDGKISLGHGMCSGAFTYTSGARYDVRVLSVLDTQGNRVSAPPHALTVDAPQPRPFSP